MASLAVALLIGSAPAAAAVPGPSVPLDRISTLESCRVDPAAVRCPQQHRPAAVGTDGSLYLIAGNRVLRRDTAQGRTVVLAGSGRKDLDCRDGARAAQACLEPSAAAIGPGGTVFVTDVSRKRVLRIAPSGSFTVVAAGLGTPYALAPDGAGGVFVGVLEGRVFRAAPGRSVRHVAGVGGCFRTLPDQLDPAALGDGGPATAACLLSVDALAFSGGVLYVADGGGNRLRAVDAAGRISTVAGNGLSPIDAFEVCPAGPVGQAGCLGSPTALAVGPTGRLYIAANATDGLPAGPARTRSAVPSSPSKTVRAEDAPTSGLPAAYVVAAFVDDEHQELAEAVRSYLLVALVALMAVGLGAWSVSGRLLRPLRDLRVTADQITHSDLTRRIDSPATTTSPIWPTPSTRCWTGSRTRSRASGSSSTTPATSCAPR